MSDPNPLLVDWIKQASVETGADPVALLATALRESGGQLNGPAGDQGTSFGPFQFHIGGALGSHSPSWASTYEAVLNRAQEFARNQVHGGPGAAAVQRPADRLGYAQAVNALLSRARMLIGTPVSSSGAAGRSTTRTLSSGPTTTRTPIQEALAILNAPTPGAALAQFRLGLGSQQSPFRSVRPEASARGPVGKVITGTGAPHIIGVPYHGTHTLGNWESDNAIDIQLPAQTPVYAVADGTIGSQIGATGGGPRFAGQRLHLLIPGNELFYQHLASIVVHAGQRVRAGQLLGYTGALNHLHLGVRNGSPMVYA